MEEVLCEPVELTESELYEVAGGDPFGNVQIGGVGNDAAIANIANVVGAATGVIAGTIVNTGIFVG